MKLKVAVVVMALVLMPLGLAWAQAPVSIYDTLKANPDYSTLVGAIEKANLVPELKTQPGPFTVFAPTNEAFAKVPKDTLDNIMKDQQILKNVLYYHIVPGMYVAKDLIELKECKTLCPTAEAQVLKLSKVGDRYMVGTANIVKADVKASNGVIHGVDTVFMPKMAPPKVP
jgi:uncharacterized surface protein with fasciclin (FAS1) repeats